MHRRNWLATSLQSLATAALLVCGVNSAPAQEPISLEDRLKAGLKCRRPEEFAFVATVAQFVAQGKLKTDLVLSTYRYAVEKRPDFPFYHFQYGLRRRAAAIGVDI
jgi:hypothetical protein